MRYLGIDFGKKRVGVAISDENGGFAFAHAVLKNDEHLVRELKKLCDEKKIGAVIVGESRNYQGAENTIMKSAKEFAAALGEATGLPVSFELEFLTSAEAERIQGKNDMLDASAAALILKSYLEKQPKSVQ